MAANKADLEILFSKLDVEDRVRFERVSRDAKVAVDDSWRKKKSLTKKDSGWLQIPGPKRCEIISKMTSLKIVDIEHAVAGAELYYQDIVKQIIDCCPIIKRIYFADSHMIWRYFQKYGSHCRVEMIDAFHFEANTLKLIKDLRPSIHIEWYHNHREIPEWTTHLVSGRNPQLDVLAMCEPTLLKHLQSISLDQIIGLEQIGHICSNYPGLKSFCFLTNELTSSVVKHLMKLQCLEVLSYRAATGTVNGHILDYLKSEQAVKLESIIFDRTSFYMSDFMTAIADNLPQLNFIKMSSGKGLIIKYYKKSLRISWNGRSLRDIFRAFPKADEFLIQVPRTIRPFWLAEAKVFSAPRRKKLIKVIIELEQKSPRQILETDNLLFMNI